MEQWVSTHGAGIYPALIGGVMLERFAPMLFDRPTDESRVANALPVCRHLIGVLDRALAETEWLAGDMPTIADHLLGPVMF